MLEHRDFALLPSSHINFQNMPFRISDLQKHLPDVGLRLQVIIVESSVLWSFDEHATTKLVNRDLMFLSRVRTFLGLSWACFGGLWGALWGFQLLCCLFFLPTLSCLISSNSSWRSNPGPADCALHDWNKKKKTKEATPRLRLGEELPRTPPRKP